MLGYVKLIDTVNSYMHKPLVDIGAIALTLPSEFQVQLWYM